MKATLIFPPRTLHCHLWKQEKLMHCVVYLYFKQKTKRKLCQIVWRRKKNQQLKVILQSWRITEKNFSCSFLHFVAMCQTGIFSTITTKMLKERMPEEISLLIFWLGPCKRVELIIPNVSFSWIKLYSTFIQKKAIRLSGRPGSK